MTSSSDPRPRLVGVAVISALLLVLAGCVPAGQRVGPGSAYTLAQLNLCLSGRAGCYAEVDYPAGVRDAMRVIRSSGADAVTLSEVCRGDIDQIAAETGYVAQFAPVASYVLPDDCVDPGGRGVFGMAVLTRLPVVASSSRPYAAQDRSIEERRWLCVTTEQTQVCTTHLEVRGRPELDAVNDAQCAEFARILTRSAAAGPLLAAGDLNRDGHCSAPGMWIGTDRDAGQLPGKQQVYATDAFADLQTSIVPLARSDHDALVVTGRALRSPSPARR